MRKLTTALSANRTLFDTLAIHYDRKPFRWWMKKFHQPVLAELHNRAPVKILDVSCGTGELLSSLAALNSQHRLYGIEVSPKMLARARKKLPSTVKLRLADVHRLPFRDNTFEYVLNTETFHHYDQQEKALQEMKRVTQKKGQIIIVEINIFFRPFHWLFQKLEPGCIYLNSKREIKELFIGAGLKHITQSRHFLFSIVTTGTKP